MKRTDIAMVVLVSTLGAAFASATVAGLQLSQQPTPPQSGSQVVTVPGSVTTPSENVPSQQAVAVKEVESPAAPSHYDDQALWALVMSFIIQYLKKSKWFGWITPESPARLKAQFGFIMAMLTTAGVHFAITGSIFEGGGASITITGLSFSAFKDVVWQWTAQQAWYQAVVSKTVPVTVVAAG